ncbi:hypothetical protein HZH66_015460 [Vespula vulgaris]|uniref:Uncharacterized protein n=1 Tax=Vespula vulgaris TaxID=7454 RepID=A0A834IWG1_VESVU|nr:hypothetical protein HZH66_015460 [Vespula vulgaris]
MVLYFQLTVLPIIINKTSPFFIHVLDILENSKEAKDGLTLTLFSFYDFCIMSTLFIYCFIGECFIQECTNFGNAIYNYEWYNLPATDSKFFLICMTRTRKPLHLTSGKFAVLSLTVFIDELGIANVRRSFNWSSSLLKCMGIWPLKNYDPIFLFYFTYLFLHCSLAYAQMFLSPKTIDDVLSNIAENIPLTMTLTKVMIIRVNRKALSKLFTEIKEYSLTEKYETKEEKMTFLNYTKLPPRFIAITGQEMEDSLTTIMFILYIFGVINTLFIYCFIGECFIQESTNFGNAIYNYEWYNLSAMDSKFFLMCIMRTKKPQCLTSGTSNCQRPEIIQMERRTLKMHGNFAIEELSQLICAPKTIDNIISNISENIVLIMTLTKITIARVNREAFRKLFMEIKEYSLTEKYETKEEKMTFLNYTKLPPRFIVITACSMTTSDILYYTSGLIFGIQIGKQNNSMGYQLPYRTLEIMDLKDTRIYALICAYQIIVIPSVLFGYVAFDCMFVNLSVQVIAQFAILSYKVKTVLNNSENYRLGMKELVLRHYRLIRLTEKLEDNFNFVIMQQLLGTTIHLCISGFYLLMAFFIKHVVFNIVSNQTIPLPGQRTTHEIVYTFLTNNPGLKNQSHQSICTQLKSSRPPSLAKHYWLSLLREIANTINYA